MLIVENKQIDWSVLEEQLKDRKLDVNLNSTIVKPYKWWFCAEADDLISIRSL